MDHWKANAEYPQSPYRFMAEFFDPAIDRWRNADDRAHKMFVILAFLDFQTASLSLRVSL